MEGEYVVGDGERLRLWWKLNRRPETVEGLGF